MCTDCHVAHHKTNKVIGDAKNRRKLTDQQIVSKYFTKNLRHEALLQIAKERILELECQLLEYEKKYGPLALKTEGHDR